MMNNQTDINNKYLNLILKLKQAVTDISECQSNETKFSVIQNAFVNQLSCTIDYAQQRLEEVRANIVWDKLVIAFFGETNAGKSTIIETFRILFGDGGHGADGEIVGDGRSDYTKVYSKYDLCINGQAFTLIDVPGIEGREDDYKDEIKDALLKAHCVFYVQGHNKEPDVKTAEKIKKYLNEWVKVYSIYNVRGGIENYDEEEERNTLFTPNVNKQIELNTDRFRAILGHCYQGNLTLQALIAMCAHASFTSQRPDLIKQQKLLLSYFGNAATAFEFSNFCNVQETISGMSVRFREYIIDANIQKFNSCVNTIVKDINECYKENAELINSLYTQLTAFKNKVHQAITISEDSSRRTIYNEIDAELEKIAYYIGVAIDEEYSNIGEYVESVAAKGGENISTVITKIIRNEVKDLSDKIFRLKKDLDKNFNLDISSFSSQTNVNLDLRAETLFGDLEFGSSDALDIGQYVMSGAGIGSYFTLFAPGIATAIGAIGGLVVGSVNYFLLGKKEKKAKVKNEVRKKIEEVAYSIKMQSNDVLQSIFKTFDQEKSNLFNEINLDKRNLEDIQQCLDDLNTRLRLITKK